MRGQRKSKGRDSNPRERWWVGGVRPWNLGESKRPKLHQTLSPVVFPQLLLVLGQGFWGGPFPLHTKPIHFYHELPSSKAGRAREERLESDRKRAMVSGEGEKDNRAHMLPHAGRMKGEPDSDMHCITVLCHSDLKGKQMAEVYLPCPQSTLSVLTNICIFGSDNPAEAGIFTLIL